MKLQNKTYNFLNSLIKTNPSGFFDMYCFPYSDGPRGDVFDKNPFKFYQNGINPHCNYWISLNTFKSATSHKDKNLAYCNASFIDVDCHQGALSKCNPVQIKDFVYHWAKALEHHKLLCPTAMICSGHGLYLVFLYKKGVKASLKVKNEWRLIAKSMVIYLNKFTKEWFDQELADFHATNPGRLLRLPQTMNSKNEKRDDKFGYKRPYKCYVMFTDGKKYDFEDLYQRMMKLEPNIMKGNIVENHVDNNSSIIHTDIHSHFKGDSNRPVLISYAGKMWSTIGGYPQMSFKALADSLYKWGASVSDTVAAVAIANRYDKNDEDIGRILQHIPNTVAKFRKQNSKIYYPASHLKFVKELNKVLIGLKPGTRNSGIMQLAGQILSTGCNPRAEINLIKFTIKASYPQSLTSTEKYNLLIEPLDYMIGDLENTYSVKSSMRNDKTIKTKIGIIKDLEHKANNQIFHPNKFVKREIDQWSSKQKKVTFAVVSTIMSKYYHFRATDDGKHLLMYVSNPHDSNYGIYISQDSLIQNEISRVYPEATPTFAKDVMFNLRSRSRKVFHKTNSNLIPVNNGIFDMKSKEFKPFSPRYVFTSKIITNYPESEVLPPELKINGWSVNKFMGMISNHDPQIQKQLWQVILDAIDGNHSRGKVVFFVSPKGSTGKSTFEALIENIVGPLNVASLRLDQLDKRFQAAALVGKTVDIGDNLQSGIYLKHSSNVHSIVTGDAIPIEEKGKSTYNAHLHLLILQSSNGMPRYKDDKGMKRRSLFIPFNHQFVGKHNNPDVKDKYLKKSSVREYVLYRALSQPNFKKYHVSDASKKLLQHDEFMSHPLLQFKKLFFDKLKLKKIPVGWLFECYKVFAKINGIHSFSKIKFSEQFTDIVQKDYIKKPAKLSSQNLINLNNIYDNYEHNHTCAPNYLDMNDDSIYDTNNPKTLRCFVMK